MNQDILGDCHDSGRELGPNLGLGSCRENPFAHCAQHYRGLASELDNFLRTEETKFLQLHPRKLGGNEYLFEIRGLAPDWNEDQDIAVETQNYIAVHRLNGPLAFSINKIDRKSRERLRGKDPVFVTLAGMRYDGSISLYRDDAFSIALGKGAFEISVSPGIQITDYPSEILPAEVVSLEIQTRVNILVETLIRCGKITDLTKANHPKNALA